VVVPEAKAGTSVPADRLKPLSTAAVDVDVDVLSEPPPPQAIRDSALTAPSAPRAARRRDGNGGNSLVTGLDDMATFLTSAPAKSRLKR
jgi:hypothetical protein